MAVSASGAILRAIPRRHGPLGVSAVKWLGALPPAVALAIAVGLLSGCGGGGGLQVSLEPTSGPPGTQIEYTVSGCADKDPGVTLYTGSVEDYNDYNLTSGDEFQRGEDAPEPKEVVEGQGGETGILVLPDDTAPGEYTVHVTCAASSEPEQVGEGQFTFDIDLDSTETGFEVTE